MNLINVCKKGRMNSMYNSIPVFELKIKGRNWHTIKVQGLAEKVEAMKIKRYINKMYKGCDNYDEG